MQKQIVRTLNYGILQKTAEFAQFTLLINRNVETDRKNVKLWDPTKDSRICSVHFVDGRPTAENPFPTEKLGYDATKRASF